MKYIEFKIKNFKWIKDIEFKLTYEPHSPVVTLVWLNESGKTSILEAIDLFSRDIPDTEKHKLIPKSMKSNFNWSIEIKAKIMLDEKDEKQIKKFAEEKLFKLSDPVSVIDVTKKYNFKESKYANLESLWNISLFWKRNGESGKKYKLTHEAQEWKDIVEFIKVSLFPKIIYYPNFLFNFPTRIYIENTKPLNQQNKHQEYVAVLQDVLDSIWNWVKIETIITKINSTTDDDKESLEAIINQMSDKITKVVFDAWWQLFEKWNKQIVLKHWMDNWEPYIEIKLKEWSESYHISERSLWFKWFFSFLLFTEFRKNRSLDWWETLFLLDEPASNLHSTAQKNLLKTFWNLTDKSKLIYTTHSHHLINPNRLHGTYIVYNQAIKNPGEDFDFNESMTDVKLKIYKQFVADHPNDQTYFQPILDALDYQPSHIEQVDDIIILEGKNDFYTLRYINEIILGNKSDWLNFYPWASADKNYNIIRLYLAWNSNFTILLDWDKAGKDAKKNYSKEFGCFVDDSILTLTDIDTSFDWLTLEDLFTENDKLKITKLFNNSLAKYDKSAFNTAIQNLYCDQSTIDLEDQTKENLKKILDFLRW